MLAFFAFALLFTAIGPSAAAEADYAAKAKRLTAGLESENPAIRRQGQR